MSREKSQGRQTSTWNFLPKKARDVKAKSTREKAKDTVLNFEDTGYQYNGELYGMMKGVVRCGVLPHGGADRARCGCREVEYGK